MTVIISSSCTVYCVQIYYLLSTNLKTFERFFVIFNIPPEQELSFDSHWHFGRTQIKNIIPILNTRKLSLSVIT